MSKEQIREIKKRLEKLTPEEEAFEKLREPGTYHIQGRYLKDHAKFPENYSEIEDKVINGHLNWCPNCREVVEKVSPTLKEAS